MNRCLRIKPTEKWTITAGYLLLGFINLIARIKVTQSTMAGHSLQETDIIICDGVHELNALAHS